MKNVFVLGLLCGLGVGAARAQAVCTERAIKIPTTDAIVPAGNTDAACCGRQVEGVAAGCGAGAGLRCAGHGRDDWREQIFLSACAGAVRARCGGDSFRSPGKGCAGKISRRMRTSTMKSSSMRPVRWRLRRRFLTWTRTRCFWWATRWARSWRRTA